MLSGESMSILPYLGDSHQKSNDRRNKVKIIDQTLAKDAAKIFDV